MIIISSLARGLSDVSFPFRLARFVAFDKPKGVDWLC